MMRATRLLPLLFVTLWALSVLVLASGYYGWFGQGADGLAGIYVILLGMPWVRWLGGDGPSSAALAILAPAINLLILWALCRLLARRRG